MFVLIPVLILCQRYRSGYLCSILSPTQPACCLRQASYLPSVGGHCYS